MSASQGSTLYGGSVSKALIYEIDNGEGLTWAKHIKTEVNVDGKPRQLTKASHAGNPLQENVTNPRRATDFPAGTTVTIDGRQLSVSKLMVTDDFTVTDWQDTFPRFQPKGLSVDLVNNPEITAVIFNRIKNATHTQLNENHSAGDSTLIAPNTLRFYDGFETLILADADATQVGTPAVLTKANILDYFFDLRDAIDPRLRNKSNLKFFCSYADADLYDRAARETQTSTAITTHRGERQITQANGSVINIVPVEGLSKDFVFATVADKSDNSNLVQGVWMENDYEVMKLYREVEADQTWNILMRMDVGVQYKSGGDIWYLNNI
jgi:hypothetical protein